VSSGAIQIATRIREAILGLSGRGIGVSLHQKADEWYRTKTMYWYRRAADLGNEEAKNWLSAHGN